MEIGGVKPDLGHIIKGENSAPAKSETSIGAANVPGASNSNVTATNAGEAINNANTSATALKDLLISFGQSPGDDNVALIRTLAESGLPSDKGSFLKLNQALKLFNLLTDGENSGNIEKAIFALKNDMPANLESVEKFQAFLGEAGNVSRNLAAIQDILTNAPRTLALEQIMRIFADAVPTGQGNSVKQPNNVPLSGSLEPLTSPINTGAAASTTITAPGGEQAPINSHLQELLSLPPDMRGEFTRGLSEILARPPLLGGGTDFQAVAAELGKFLNSSQPLTESTARELLGQLIKEMPEFTRSSGNLAEFTSSPSTESPSNRPPITLPELTRAFEALRLAPQENSLGLLEEALNNLKFKTEEALKIANNSSDEIPAALYRALENINSNLSFIEQLKTCVYIPIPLSLPTGHTEGELYIFKDGRNKGSKGGAKTALIGLNTVSIGRVEAYIQKEDNRLNLQFRLEDPKTSNLIKEHSNELIELLERANLKLTALSTTGLDAPFNILQKEPDSRSGYKLSEHSFDIKA